MPKEKPFNYIRACLIVISGGAIGNFIDRFINGFVVDFLYFKPFNFPVFNIADIFIVCGTISLGYIIMFHIKEETKDSKKEEI